MGYLARGIERVGGRRVLLGLGGLYIAVAIGFPVTTIVGDRSDNAVLIISLLVGGSGLVLSYAGYRLPRTDIRPDLYHVVAGWCIRAIEVMLGILLLMSVLVNQTDPLANFLGLPALASVAGLGMGIHDGRAKTRALDAEEYSQELERYKTIVETVNDGIFVADSENHFVLVNDAYCELVGYDREDLIGSHTSLVADDQRVDGEEIIEQVERDLAEGNPKASYETSLQTASGEIVEAEWTVAPLPEPDGGEPDRVGVVRDVTERNEREHQLKQQNDRLESFAGMLAHELRNPLTIAQIYHPQEQPQNDDAAEHVDNALDRIEEMVDILLVTVRGSEAEIDYEPVAIAEIVSDAWKDLSVDTEAAQLLEEANHTIRADPVHVEHLFRNLFRNSIEHGGEDVTVRVGDLPDGFYLEDDGVGIPEDAREDVREAGFTSKADGIGLGLTFIDQLAETYNWNWQITESETGGARFEFTGIDLTTNERNTTDTGTDSRVR